MKKIRPISYTSRDFDSIKEDLVNYAKRYYPNTFQDFNEASFGAMMLDLVAYVGDQLSFYIDYQANESFIDTALEYKNIVKLAKQMGFKMPGAASSVGNCSFYAIIPALASNGNPDLSYSPILRKGSLVSAANGLTFTLNETVDFSKPENELTVAKVNQSTGVPTHYAIKTFGQVVSGQQFQINIDVGNYEKFLRLNLDATNVIEILSVIDSQGNEFFEVEHLTQDVVLSEEPNFSDDKDVVPNIMKIKPVPRRFVTEFDESGNCFLQFGFGSAENLTTDVVADPADVVLDTHGKNHITDAAFDPSNLIKTDKFGVVPTNTTLTVRYRANNVREINVAAGAITKVIFPDVIFKNRNTLSEPVASEVIGTLEVENEEPILGDSSIISAEELRQRAMASFSSQNRAVTRADYISLCYRMPSKFGKIKRANIMQDSSALKRNLNLFVLSEDVNGNFIEANSTIKNNLKTWLNQYRMMNDTIDIHSAKIINYGINFEIITDLGVNKFDVLSRCTQKLIDKLSVKSAIGESVHITKILKLLNEVPGVTDTVNVFLENKAGGIYSGFFYDIDANISDDGRFLLIPEDAVAEIFFPQNDIVGVVR
tara:strand:+ start:18046 stop:19839 length:1794 start_codon:yes stop_codon:yes gene_type:complete